MKNRWLRALIRTVVFLAAAHVVFLILGFLFGKQIGIFHWPMVWAHWSDGAFTSTTGIVSAVVLYFIVYSFFTGSDSRGIDTTE